MWTVAALNWAKNNWLLIVAVLCWLGSLSLAFYGGYKVADAGRIKVQAEYNQYKVAQEQRFSRLQVGLIRDATIANQKLKQQETEREENDRVNRKKLTDLRKQLERVQLDAAFVELLNDSTGRKPVAKPDKRSDGPRVQDPQASTDTGGNAGQGIQAKDFTLFDLGENILENNKNHQDCIDQVVWWQDFYRNMYQQFEGK
jgi:hypothetical protein